MVSFFKNFAKGVLYVLVLPAIIAGLAVYAVVAFFVFIYLAIKGLILFFTGRSLYEDLPEDVKAKKILRGEPLDEPEPSTEPKVETINTGNSNEEETISNKEMDPFYVPEYLRSGSIVKEESEINTVEEEKLEDFIKEESQSEPTPVVSQQEESIHIEQVEEEVEEEPIIVQKSSQNSNILHISDIDNLDDSDEDNGSGINIDFE